MGEPAATASAPAPSGVRERVGVQWPLGCAAAFLALCTLNWGFVTDDAWITIRYAENLANGHGFAWNPGGERVEGFSNPLLVIVEALAHRGGLPALDAARAVGIGSGLGLIALLWRLGPTTVGTTATRVAMLLVALYPPMAVWAVGGLETLPAALALTAGVLLLVARDAVRGGAALAVLPWLRPEGLGVALAAAILAEGPGLLRRSGRRQAARRLALAAGLPLVSQGLLVAGRLAIYGHLLANPALYKSGRGMTTDVLERFVVQTWPLLGFAACGLLAARGRQRILAVPPLVYAVGSVGMLDSVNTFNRLMLPVWPVLALLAGVAIATVHRRLRRSGAAVAAALTALLVLPALAMADIVRRFAHDYPTCAQDARLEAAAWLRANTPPGTVYSVSDAGLLPHRAGPRVAVDQLRLNEAQLQRTGRLPLPQEIALVYDARPEVLVLASRTPDRFTGRYAADRTMTADARFKGYRLAAVARGDGPGCDYHLFLYRR